jgi:arsenate reductase (thioredoxin)
MSPREDHKPFNVLFLCTGNSARSLIAEAILNRLGQGKFRAFSAGSQPKGRVHPYSLDLLRRMNHDVSGLRSKSLSNVKQPHRHICEFANAVARPTDPAKATRRDWQDKGYGIGR